MIIPPTPAPPHEAESSTYRLKRGTKLADLPPVPPHPAVPPLSSLDGPFQLAEYLALKVRHDPHDVKGLVDVPVGDASVGGKGPERCVWIYEHLRRIPIDLTPLVVALLPICNASTCPEMKAEEWLYLCSAHGGGAEQCCAIDYILHTLDSTTALVNSSQNFPSRLQIPQASQSHFPSIFRRLSRIFSHAYFHHHETFSLAEAETSLYARFLGLCETYQLVGENLLLIPRHALAGAEEEEEGPDDSSDEEEDDNDDDNDGEEDEEEDGDDDQGEASDYRGRGDLPHGERRTQSLDRAFPTAASLDKSASPSRNQHSASPKDPEGHGEESAEAEEGDALASGRMGGRSGMTLGRGTLGRGKQPRSTMLWGPSLEGSEEASASTHTEDTSETSVKGRDRSESIESAIHVPSLEPTTEVPDQALEDLAAEVPAAESAVVDEAEEEQAEAEDELPVPKDEIELLEEEGVLKPQETVAPLAPASLGTAEQPATTEEAAAPSGDDKEVDSKESLDSPDSIPLLKGPVVHADDQSSRMEDEERAEGKAEDSAGRRTDGKGDAEAASSTKAEHEVPSAEAAPAISPVKPIVDRSSKVKKTKTSGGKESKGPDQEEQLEGQEAEPEKKDKKLPLLKDRVSPSPIKGKGKPSAAEVVKGVDVAGGSGGGGANARSAEPGASTLDLEQFPALGESKDESKKEGLEANAGNAGEH
ncbi:hypothetical protein IAU60_001627 [Kwoniella sp. DSM 27419]